MDTSDPMEQLAEVHRSLEMNCSRHDLFYTPPNVTTHYNALGVVGMGIAIGGTASTSLLVILFIINLVINIIRSPMEWRRLLAWITSMPMVISLFSLTTFLVPRAGGICDVVKQSYLPFLLMHFIDLAVVVEGGVDNVLATLEQDGTKLNLCAPLCCCFGMCCCSGLPVTKKNFHRFRSLVNQASLWQFMLNVAAIILQVAELQLIVHYEVAEAIFQAIAVLNILVFAFGNWGFNILIKAFKGPLESDWNRNIRKGAALSVFITILKLQNFILGVLEFTGYIPCLPPSISARTMKKSIDAVLSMAESLIFGIVFIVVFMVKKKDKDKYNVNGHEQTDALIQPMSRYWNISPTD